MALLPFAVPRLAKLAARVAALVLPCWLQWQKVLVLLQMLKSLVLLAVQVVGLLLLFPPAGVLPTVRDLDGPAMLLVLL